jgi:glycosyltransferase involved in cell wall biosynthesis
VSTTEKELKLDCITIGITCYNAENTIARAIESAMLQDWPNYEVIIVNDCSTDNSQAVIDEMIEKYNTIRCYINNNNMGCAFTRNIIVNKAKGKFIVFFDDDDTSRQDRLSIQYNRIVKYEKESNQKLVACYASGKKHYPNNYEMNISAIGSENNIPGGYEVADYLLFNKKRRGVYYGGGTPACSLMIRKSIFEEIGGFDERFRRLEDADFAIRLAMKGGYFIGIKEPVLQQFASKGNDKSSSKEYESVLLLLYKYKEYLEKNGIYDYMVAWSELRYRHFNRETFKAIRILFKLIINFPVRTIRHFLISASKRKLHEIKTSNF